MKIKYNINAPWNTFMYKVLKLVMQAEKIDLLYQVPHLLAVR